MAAEFLVIRREDELVVPFRRDGEVVVGDGVGGAEVDGKDQISALKLEALVGLVKVEKLGDGGV